MKILYHHRIASKDGQYVHVEELTEALKKLGHEIIMVCPNVTENTSFGSEGGLVPLLKRYIPGFLYELLEMGYALYAYLKLSQAVKRHNPDCLYERYNLYTPAGVWIKKRYKLPMLLEVNAPLFLERKKYNGIALERLACWSERYTWNGADFVLPVTEVLARMVLEAGVPRERVRVVANGIDLQKFDSSKSLEAKRKLGLDNRLVLGFSGFMREWHGLDRAVDIIAASPKGDRHLLLVGDGPARASIEARAKALGVSDYVTVTGIVPREDMASYVAAFDIAMQPDVVEYASPLKLFEYMAMGRAIVAPDKPNIREVLKHERDALLFDPSDLSSLLAALERLCRDAELRERLGHEALATIKRDEYTWSGNARTVEMLIEELGISGVTSLSSGEESSERE